MLYRGTLHIAPMAEDAEGNATVSGPYEKVPTPQSYTWGKEDLDAEEGTGRNNATGEMFRDRVSTKRKLNFTWPPLSIANTSFLLQRICPEEKNNTFISVQYLDPHAGNYLTKTFYAGSPSASCGHCGMWSRITISLIEK